jgi:exonuclease VII small subunit
MSTTITLESGFDRLDEIITALPEATVEESLQLMAEGHGIHRALDTALQTYESRLEEIKAGQNLPDYIVGAIAATPPAAPPPAAASESSFDFPSSPSDDDIPF